MKQESDPRIVIVAGMPRAATTFLYHTLAKHPNVWVPPRKELEYFSVNAYRGREWYHAFFEGAAPDQVGFDISPIYFMVPEAPDRIHEYDAEAKVVLLIRDPVEFVLSFYANRQGVGDADLSFEEFLEGYEYEKDGRTVDLVFHDGRIGDTIERYRSLFGSNLLLCSYEAVREDPLPVLQAVESFAGIPNHFDADNFENVRINASDQKNIVWLNKLMHQKWFADLVVRLVPKSLILKARYWVQTRRTGGAEDESDGSENPDRALAAVRLEHDAAYVEELFLDAKIKLGTGEAFRRI